MSQVPNFIYIGPDKAGSSWLHEVLVRHPQVYMPEAKDLYFFDRYYERGLPWYLGQFKAAGPQHRVIGEVCQDYLFHPSAPQRIAESLPDPRFMVSLRDPADRAYSSYLYMRKQGQDPGSFLQALQRRPELLEHGRYATHLQRYVDVFGEDKLYIAVFDDLKRDPQEFVGGLLDWLDVDPMVLDDEQLGARLPAGAARSAVLARAVRRSADFVREHDGANVVGRVKRSRAVQRALYRPLSHDKAVMTAEERKAVHDALGTEVARLDECFGLNLTGRWAWPTSDDALKATEDSGTS